MPSKAQQVEIGGRELTISNVDKIFFPESGFTKGEAIGFYSAIADSLLPHLRDRPLTLKRYPDGVTGEHFYEKNAPKHTPTWVKTFAVPRSEGGGEINYVLCNDLPTLVWVTNLGDIEKHVLLARAPELNHPTSIVFDLDPGEPAGLIQCGEVALRLKKLLAAWGLESFVKVSGSKGLHLSVPLNGATSYEVTQPFAKAIAELVAAELPQGVVSDMAKKLRTGKVLIDWSQNSDFKTTVSVYAMRAKGTRPYISMPVTWGELARAVKRQDDRSLSFPADAAVKRLAKIGDLFAPVLELTQALPAVFTKALAAGPPPKLSRWPRNTRKSASTPNDRSLRAYVAKRAPTRTPEPMQSEKKTSEKGPHRFVIQKHEASQLHYDFRLEMQGVLRSWAVPKGPPTKLRETRLAMHVEDHPLSYERFEGTIPSGNYGAGTVMVWDYGVYGDITGNDAAAYHSGKMHLVLEGQKLRGEWILVKDKREPDSNRWLLIKAGESIKPFSAKIDDTSAISKRSMAGIAKANDAQWQSNRPAVANPQKGRASPKSSPKFIPPMQCKPVTALPTEGDWSYEIKFDGYRALAVKVDGVTRLYSRNEKLLDQRFPGLVRAFADIPGDFTIDGEIVALNEAGQPSFQLLQNSQSETVSVHFYAFDLLHLKGEVLEHRAIEERRTQLETVMENASDPLRLSPLLQAPAGEVIDAVRKLGLEGIVGKRAGSVYEAGERSGAWVKHRTDRAQEFVIGGYIPATDGFDALLVGVYEKGALQYVAKVRNGFVPRVHDAIWPLLKQRGLPKCPFKNLPQNKSSRWGEALTAAKMKECRWVKPTLVANIAFLEWTDGGHLRHCKFIAMRDDKLPRDIVRES